MLDYGVIGNCQTCALIKKNASVEWMCYPAFSSPSVFAKILDDNKGGSLEIIPVGDYEIVQEYLPYTAILKTTFVSPQDSFEVVDFFPRYRKLLHKGNERLVRQNCLVRIIKKVKGVPKIKIHYEPKPDYARGESALVDSENFISCKLPSDSKTEQTLNLASNIPLEFIRGGKEVALDSAKYLVIGADVSGYNVKRCSSLFHSTKKYWQGWCKSLVLPEANREIIIRSAITLKLLTYSRTGAIVAAPTTSLPEVLGSDRTFDYRYCWVRDAALCVDALKKIGRNYEPKKLLSFVINRALEDDYIQIMYGLEGETKLKEYELGHLSGFKNSRPVRVGNAAYSQLQHDIYGEILDIMYLYFVYYEFEKKISRKYWRFIKYIVNQIRFHWDKPDSGIWEFRNKYAHYTHSKMMCFLGVDRAIKIARHFSREGFVNSWSPLREEIREDILQNGYNQEIGAFTMSYGSKELDASLLQMAYHEFLEPNDPRLVGTVRAIERELRQDYLVQRYKAEDDFGKSSSAFTICSFWLIEALFYIGEVERARELFEKIMQKGNHLGLFSEDLDIKSGKLLGNFPQGYTHTAIINTAVLLSEWSAKRKKLEQNNWGKREV